MLKDAFKALFGRSSAPARAQSSAPRKPVKPQLPAEHSRPSQGLKQFFSNLERSDRLRILDLSGAGNLDTLLQYGHHVYTENVMGTLEEVFGTGDDFFARQGDEDLIERFLSQTFANLHGPFDGALVWDRLQFLQPPLLEHAVGHLHRLLEPGAMVHAFFSSNEQAKWLMVNTYRIESPGVMRVTPLDYRPCPPPFNARTLEKVFADFSSVKFFLSRDHVRELIVTR